MKKELYEDNSPSKQSPSKSVDKSANESKVVIKKEPGVDYDDEGTGKGICITVNSALDSKNMPGAAIFCGSRSWNRYFCEKTVPAPG